MARSDRRAGAVGGKRILPEGWVDYSARLTPSSETYGYGAGFWTIAARPVGPPSAPGSACRPTPSWSQGQYIVIVPSARLVVVRRGMAHDRYEDIEGVAHLVADRLPPRRNR